VFLYAFDLIELNGDDMRRDPLEVRKATARIYRRDGSCNGADDPSGHDGGVGCDAELVTDLPS
jgi:hypothetical protein